MSTAQQYMIAMLYFDGASDAPEVQCMRSRKKIADAPGTDDEEDPVQTRLRSEKLSFHTSVHTDRRSGTWSDFRSAEVYLGERRLVDMIQPRGK